VKLNQFELIRTIMVRLKGWSLERVDDLGVALLDFSSVDDLVFWLGWEFWVVWKKPKEISFGFLIWF
jgi:hypothetical protein